MEKRNPLPDRIDEALNAIKAAQTDAGVAKERLSVEQLKRTHAEMDRDAARAQVTGMVRILSGLLRHTDLTDDVRVEIQNALDVAKAGR